MTDFKTYTISRFIKHIQFQDVPAVTSPSAADIGPAAGFALQKPSLKTSPPGDSLQTYFPGETTPAVLLSWIY